MSAEMRTLQLVSFSLKSGYKYTNSLLIGQKASESLEF
jgi:hypothetical protein